MASQTLKLQRRGPGRPKTRDTEVITLNLDRMALRHLKELALKHHMPMNHVVETLILSALRDDYPLKVREENEKLKEMIRGLESEIEKLREVCGNEVSSPYAKKVRELNERIHKVLGMYGELKLFELVMRVFNVPRGERLHNKIDEFLNEYFIETDNNKLISKDLNLVIIKTATGPAGWIVRKLQDT